MNDFSIFSNNYTKNVYILGASFSEKCVMSNVYAISKVFYLKSHGNKYELKMEGICDKDVNEQNLEISCKKVDNYTFYKNTKYYACDGDKEGEIKLNIIADKKDNINVNLLDKDNLSLFSYLVENTSENNNIVLTNAFGFIYSETNDGIIGAGTIKPKFFTKCSEYELMEILNINQSTIDKNHQNR